MSLEQGSRGLTVRDEVGGDATGARSFRVQVRTLTLTPRELVAVERF